MRTAVTILAIAIGMSFIAAVYFRSANKAVTPATTPGTPSQVATTPGTPPATPSTAPQAPAQETQSDQASTPTADQPAASADAQADAQAPSQTTQDGASQPASSQAPAAALVPETVAQPQASSVGSDDPASPFSVRVDTSPWGASIDRVNLAAYSENVMTHLPYTVQGRIPVRGADGQIYSHYPFAARSIQVDGQHIPLANVAWRLTAPGTYELDLLRDGQPAVRLSRRYSIAAGADNYEILLQQQVENLTGRPITVVWEQSIQAEQPTDTGSYMGDQRRLFIGYYDLNYDPQRQYVLIDDAHVPHPKVLEAYKENKPFFWPLSNKHQAQMVWFGETNRYFASVVHRPTTQDDTGKTFIPSLDELFPKVDLHMVQAAGPIASAAAASASTAPTDTLIYALTSRPIEIAPHGKADLDLAFFAGPRLSDLFHGQPYKDLGFINLIRYELSCAFCTFQWLAKALLDFLKGIHYLLRDWGVAIIILVLVVRIILHPITKKSQIAMTKMGKQMATMQPEIEKIKKKYANDQTKQNQEIMKLYREKGVNPAGMLGCLPMFLQMPIWIALYAMLYFAIELRHQPAFYGVFQAISGGQWGFLADLSSPDNFIRFSKSFTLNLFFVHPQFSGVNIIPLLMAVFFYFQQALMMPPPANEQQAQQQKIGKYMTLMIPIFLYSAPSGLTLYMLASSIGGMIDGWLVRKHIKKLEEAGTLFAPKERKAPKPGGIMDRIHKAIEAQQNKITNQQKKTPRPPRK